MNNVTQSKVNRAVNAWANALLVPGSDAYIYALRDLHGESVKYGARYVAEQYAYPRDLLGRLPDEAVQDFGVELVREYQHFFGA